MTFKLVKFKVHLFGWKWKHVLPVLRVRRGPTRNSLSSFFPFRSSTPPHPPPTLSIWIFLVLYLQLIFDFETVKKTKNWRSSEQFCLPYTFSLTKSLSLSAFALHAHSLTHLSRTVIETNVHKLIPSVSFTCFNQKTFFIFCFYNNTSNKYKGKFYFKFSIFCTFFIWIWFLWKDALCVATAYSTFFMVTVTPFL
jgi:hypothetical protein